MTIETDAGIVSAEVRPDNLVTISLPPPEAFRADRPLRVGDQTIQGSSITVGVPHYVLFPAPTSGPRTSSPSAARSGRIASCSRPVRT